MSETLNSTEVQIDKKDPVYLAKRQAEYQQKYRDKKKAELAEIARLAQQVPLIVQDKDNTVLHLNDQLQRRENELRTKADEITTLLETIEANTRDIERLQAQLERLDNDLISKDTIIQQYKNELIVKNTLVNNIQLQLQSLQQRNIVLEPNAKLGEDFTQFFNWLRINGPEQFPFVEQCYKSYKTSPK